MKGWDEMKKSDNSNREDERECAIHNWASRPFISFIISPSYAKAPILILVGLVPC